MSSRKIKLTLSYDGSNCSGWQIQPGQQTIQGILTEAVSSLIGTEITIRGASRTDAGVSALGQCAQMTIDSPIPTENLAKAINGRLPNNIAILEAVEVPEAFDVISDVTTKLYRYTICTAKIRPVLQVNHCWHHPYNLDISMMAEAAQKLVGTHDFKSFASAADTRENSVRTIFRCDISAENDWIFVDVEGDGFLYNMVRNIVGTLAEAGAGRITPDDITLILDAKNRTAAGPIAPPQGLCLRWIKY